MGGGSNPVAKARDKVKKKIKDKGAEGVLEFGASALNPFGATGFAASKISRKAGVKADLIFNPAGATAAQAGESLIDDPKAAKKQAKELAQRAATAQKAQLADLKGREAQSEAEGTAAKELTKSKARQRRRSKGKGRRSTILTEKTGGVGGTANQGRKNLLGL